MTEKRDAYVQKLKARLDEWNADIDKLAAKADQANADVKIEYYQQLEDLRSKRNDLEDKIEAIEQSAEDAWGDIKSGIDLAWEAMNEAIKSATSRFR